MGRKKIIKEKELLQAIIGCRGNVSTVADRLQCCWDTADAAIKASPQALKLFTGEENRLLDKVESKAYKKAEDGDGVMIRFILATKGKKRGYTYEAEQANDDAEPDTEVNINVTGGEPAPIGFVDDEQQESEQA